MGVGVAVVVAVVAVVPKTTLVDGSYITLQDPVSGHRIMFH